MGDVEKTFLRGKVAPFPGMLINLQEGSNVIGQPYGWGDVPFEFVPLPASALRSAYKVGGIDNALRVFGASQIGVGESSY